MCRYYRIFLKFFFSIFFIFNQINCSQPSTHSDSKSIKDNSTYIIKIIATIGIEEAQTEEDKPYQFAGISNIDCDPEGNLYVMDSKLQCVKVFDQKGKFLKKMFQRGRGPNEIYGAGGLRINEFSNSLFLLNEFGYRMKQFDLNGNYMRTIQLPEQFYHQYEFTSKNDLIYIAKVKHGEDSYHNFKRLDIEKEKITKRFIQTKLSERESYFNNLQRFVIKDGLLWTSLINEIELKAFNLSTGQWVKKLAITSTSDCKENRTASYTGNGGKWVGVLGYNYAQPLLLNSELFVIWTVQDYNVEKGTREALLFPESSKLSLYRIVNNEKPEKVDDLGGCDFMRLEATYKNRIILSARDPYPHIKIIEVKKVL